MKAARYSHVLTRSVRAHHIHNDGPKDRKKRQLREMRTDSAHEIGANEQKRAIHGRRPRVEEVAMENPYLLVERLCDIAVCDYGEVGRAKRESRLSDKGEGKKR